MDRNILEAFLKAFHIEANVVSVRFVDEKGDLKESELSLCTAVDRARRNIPSLLSRKSCACVGGRYWLGLSRNPAVLKDAIPRYLAEREKFFVSKSFARKFLEAHWPRPHYQDKYVRVEALLESTAEPDAVIFLCNGDQAGRLLGLAQFSQDTPLKLTAFHAMCAVVANVVAGNGVDVCFIDPMARQRGEFKPDEIAVMFSRERLERALLDFERSGFPYTE